MLIRDAIHAKATTTAITFPSGRTKGVLVGFTKIERERVLNSLAIWKYNLGKAILSQMLSTLQSKVTALLVNEEKERFNER